jgi:hypothetical protein
VDQQAKARYEQFMKSREEKRVSLDALLNNIDATSAEHQAKIAAFLARLRKTREKLSERFSSYMQALGVRGEVALVNEASISNLGLSVRVSFREGADMTQLSTTQSGGERALSTMMVLLAMQESTPLPFRVVDEINQGMSAYNERGVMQTLARLFDSVGADGKSLPGGGGAGRNVARQLFVITPKLLPDLLHAPSMRSSIIFNGPQVTGGAAVHSYFLSFAALSRGAKINAQGVLEILDGDEPTRLADQPKSLKRKAAAAVDEDD